MQIFQHFLIITIMLNLRIGATDKIFMHCFFNFWVSTKIVEYQGIISSVLVLQLRQKLFF